jgi:hypothetical protein
MLTNSKYTRFPIGRQIHIDRGDFDIEDSSEQFWPRAEAALEALYERLIRPELTGKHAPTHLTIAAFAPIPLLMKLGALIGDKTDASVLDLPTEKWLWDQPSHSVSPKYRFDVPAKLPREVSVVVSISNIATPPSDERPVVEFRAEVPNRGIIRTEADVLEFRRQFNVFLMALIRAGVEVLHLMPATPLCASVEIGRMLLPKTFQEVRVWEWQAPAWRPTLLLKGPSRPT